MVTIIHNGPGADDRIARFIAELIVELMQIERVLPNARPSILLDHHAGRLSGIAAINGMAVEFGRQPGIPTPYQ
jgi:2-dehydropantoate 2-reductase